LTARKLANKSTDAREENDDGDEKRRYLAALIMPRDTIIDHNRCQIESTNKALHLARNDEIHFCRV